MNCFRKRLWSWLIVLGAPSAFAAGFQINEISPGLEGSALAGAAAAENDVSAFFMNPATLATLKENQIYLGGSVIIPSVSAKDESAVHTVNIPGIPASSITAPVIGSTSQSNIGQNAFVPTGFFGWRVTDRIFAGLSLVSPFGLTTSYDNSSVLRFAAQKSSVRSLNINPAIAFKLNEQWMFGLGFQAQYAQAVFSNFNGPYTGDPAVDAFIAATNPTNLSGSGWGYGYTVGVLFKPAPCTRIGLGYRSQVVESLSGDGQQYAVPGPVVPAPSQDFLFNAQTSVSTSVKFPAVLMLSAAQDIYNWTVKATAAMNFWSSFNRLSIIMPDAFATTSVIQTKWHDAMMYSLGADYRMNNCWTFRAGTGYDQTPTRNGYRDPRIPDADRYWLTAGATYRLSKNVSVDAAYEHIFMQDQTINVTQATGLSATSTVPLEVNHVSAKYTGHADIVAVALRYSFN